MELRQSTKMTQEMRMTPQLQQAIKLLLMPRFELEQENPALEIIEPGSDDHTESLPQDRAPTIDSNIEEQSGLKGKDQESIEVLPSVQDELTFARLLEQYQDLRPPDPPGKAPDDDLPSVENKIEYAQSLTDYLWSQVQIMDFNYEEGLVAREIIGNLDEDGYVREDALESACQATGASMETALLVLNKLQEMDPPGIAARDLRECLLIQARILYPDEPLLEVLIRDFLDKLKGRTVVEIPGKMNITQARFNQLRNLLESLQPKPGAPWAEQSVEFAIPDVIVTKNREGIQIELNENGLPKLRISRMYNYLVSKGTDKKTIDYIKERVRSAEWLVKSLFERQRTIRRVAQAIFTVQEEFIDHGPHHLKPLVMRNIAESLGLHESTISRATSNKYAQTPHGVFELKYFFGSAIQTDDGDSLAAEAMRRKIDELIKAEDPRKPLSDSKITAILNSQGYNIKRRTVAKYRIALKYLCSNERVKI